MTGLMAVISWTFLSTPSVRRATAAEWGFLANLSLFLSTPSARRATGGTLPGAPSFAISIHALREEGDPPHTVARPAL